MTDKLAENISVINFDNIENAITDYFVICEAKSDRQAIAIAESVERKLRSELKEHLFHIEGKENAEWIIMDYYNVIVHIFRQEARTRYNLEALWGDAQITHIETNYTHVELDNH